MNYSYSLSNLFNVLRKNEGSKTELASFTRRKMGYIPSKILKLVIKLITLVD
jgi:hypothetical protein